VPADASVAHLEFGSFDRDGNFFTDGFDTNGESIIGEIKGGCKGTTMTVVTVGNNDGWLGSVHVDKNDQPAILDINPPGNGPARLYTYAQPTEEGLGNPISTAYLQGSNRGAFFEAFTFQASGLNLFLPDASGENINEYAYPAGGVAEKTISLGSGHVAYGVAACPPLLK
jgi:hypothetical protein